MSSRVRVLAIGVLVSACGADEPVARPGNGSAGSAAAGTGGTSGAAGAGGAASDATADSAGGSAGSPDGAAGCQLTNAESLAVKAIDLEGYPPYTIDGCRLAYVSATSGALVLRDLSLDTEVEMAPASESPRRPTLSGEILAWQSGEGAASKVRIAFGGGVTTANGAFDRAGEPRATADAVVFTGWLGPDDRSDTDVFLVRPDGGPAELVLGGPGQQRFADVSETHIAVSDFSEDPGGVYSGDGTSLSDLVVLDRNGGPPQRKRATGKQAFPMLGARHRMVFLEWIGVHPVPKFQEYTIRAVELAALGAEPITIASVKSDRPTVRPVARGNFVQWVERPLDSASRLYRAELDRPPAPSAVSGLEGLELFAPAASAALTVIAVQPLAGGAPTLRSVTR
jgi:hypothetical protein